MATKTKTAAKKRSQTRNDSAKANGSKPRRVARASANGNLGQLKEPKSPMPAQHQRKPGIESKLRPRPRYEAPLYKGSGKLNQKVALITGGDSGIGRAVAVLFAREGADVAFTHLRQEQSDAQATRAAIEAEGRKALLLSGDLREPEFCREAVNQTVKEFGKLDILVNNAAFQQHQETLADLTDEQLDRTFKTNIYAYFRVTKAALPHLKRGSAIVNTGSITGLEGSKHLLDYAAKRERFTRSRSLWPRAWSRTAFALTACRPALFGLRSIPLTKMQRTSPSLVRTRQ